MSNPQQERRRQPRLEKNIPLKISSSDFDIVTETRNLSCAGAYCRIDHYLEPMTKLKINFLLPLKKNNKITTKRISCQGVVVRVEPQIGDQLYNIAIYFSEIQQGDRKCIAQYVDSSLVNKPAQE